MDFDIKDKVALITGGAQGLGFAFAEQFLKNGLKGVTIADIDSAQGEIAVEELNRKYGLNKVIFVKTDVTDINEFENAFKKTVDVFKQVDILINNAGISDEIQWKKLVEININGVLHGMVLGLDNYLKNFKSTNEALIVNLCSITNLQNYPALPFYSMSKFAVMGMVKAWGSPEHFQRTGVRVFGICPGYTETRMVTCDRTNRFLGPSYKEIADTLKIDLQSAEFVAVELMKTVKKAFNGSLWVIEKGEPAYEYILNPREIYKPSH